MALTSIEVTFNEVTDEFYFELTGTSPISTEWFIGIVGPNGNIKTLDTGTPDVVGTSGTATIPTTDPTLEDGTYAIEVRMWPSGVEAGQTIKTLTFTYASTGTMTYQLTHDASNIRIEDLTVYPTLNSSGDFTRSTVLTGPVISGVSGQISVTFAQKILVNSMIQGDGKIYTNVLWTISGTVDGDFQYETDVWTIYYNRDYTGSGSLNVQIGTDPCAIIPCLDEKWQEFYSSACNYGGFSRLPDRLQDDMAKIMGDLMMYNYWVACGDNDNALIYYQRIANTLGEDCTLTSGPTAVSGVQPGITWTTIPGSAFVNGFTPSGVTPPQFLIVNGAQMYFKGVITPTAVDGAGIQMIDPVYWSDLGISFTDGMYLHVHDQTIGVSTPILYYLGTVSGTLQHYAYAGVAVLRPFIIVGSLPVTVS